MKISYQLSMWDQNISKQQAVAALAFAVAPEGRFAGCALYPWRRETDLFESTCHAGPWGLLQWLVNPWRCRDDFVRTLTAGNLAACKWKKTPNETCAAWLPLIHDVWWFWCTMVSNMITPTSLMNTIFMYFDDSSTLSTLSTLSISIIWWTSSINMMVRSLRSGNLQWRACWNLPPNVQIHRLALSTASTTEVS